MTTRTLRTPLVPLLLVLALAALVLLVPGPEQRADAAPSRSAPSADPELAPGRLGALEVGMTRREALDTGMVRARYSRECGRDIRLTHRNKPAFVGYLSRRAGGDARVSLIGLSEPAWTTSTGAGVGTTLAQLRRDYGERLEGPFTGMYGSRAFDLRRGKRVLSFLFPAGELRPRSEVGYVFAARGAGVHDYEGGPCD